jgi:hypothetical protein
MARCSCMFIYFKSNLDCEVSTWRGSTIGRAGWLPSNLPRTQTWPQLRISQFGRSYGLGTFLQEGGEQQASKEWWQRMQVIFHTLDIPVFKLKCINLDDVDLLFHPHIVVGFRSLRSWVSGATQSRCLAGSLGQQMGYILKQTINTL